MCVFYDGIRRLNRNGFMEKPGIVPAIPGVQGIALIHYTTGGGGGEGVQQYCFCGRVPWLYQYWPGGFVFTVVLCPGTREGSTGSGSGFKASQNISKDTCIYYDLIFRNYLKKWLL